MRDVGGLNDSREYGEWIVGDWFIRFLDIKMKIFGKRMNMEDEGEEDV